MTTKQLAAFYATFWSRGPEGSWVLADNAPHNLRSFVGNRAPTLSDRSLICEALMSVGSGAAMGVPPLRDLLHWFAEHSEACRHGDEALASRQPPKTVSTLMRTAYLAEASAIRAEVASFVKEQIDNFNNDERLQ